ncbi:TetR/AcrR family transcriptional regulator [Actinomycetospora termitidis]|uniref:Helix-turn-helix domain-containing protein n=1 Tax=Actinomycetospora termitidis TaxID=3053470 RepID=A0ABT7M6I7_9PSEU|nr:TetR/AcrR family transcriptional regulator [Actinomycetospora sp. Odt1-22]MDL5156245.1 helix-turn-helix domain-containing protein [Actinomycetospora sp. Odt1-22]
MASTDRAMRADARKNRDLLIAVAREHVRRHGVTTSLEAIARDAGVGPGTLYRHFPDRECLLAEVLRLESDELDEARDRVAREVDVARRLDAWLGEVEQHMATYRGLSGPLVGALEGAEPTPLGLACQEMIATTERFLAEAQEAGVARTDVTAHDLVGCAAMLAWLGSTGPAGTRQADGARDILRHGYRAGA